MPLETNFNVSPYYDDFNEEKNYHRILFRPGVAIQARELTQLQTILQNQVERLGDNVFKTGTIIKGCTITTDFSYNYIKIRDNQVDGQPVSLGSYSNTLIVQETSNLQSFVVNFIAGLESQDPDLSTLYIKYLNTGTNGEKTYGTGDTIKVFNRARTVESISIITGGSLYSNNDVIVFSGGGGTGASAVLTTDSSGEIVDVSILSKGAGYTTTPNVSITTSTGSGATLSSLNYIAEVTVSSVANSVGTGVAVKTSEGVVYQKGTFIRVDQQETILEKYNNLPDNKVVGFRTVESIVNSNIDSTLLDVATGTPNFAAPGANRIKLTPTLTVLTKQSAQSNSEFLALLEYQGGNVVKDKTTTQFNSINREVSRRTFEESGNYVINTIPLDIEAISGNTTHFNLVIGAGTAYVNGQRVQTLNNIKIPQRKGTDTANTPSQTINTQYGNYVIVDQLLGTFDIKTGTTINLRSAAATDVSDNSGGTPSAPGSLIGTARVKSLEYHSGIIGTPECQYRLFLFDIRMSSSKSFKDVRSVSIGSTAVADTVLDSFGNSILRDTDTNTLVFNTGTNAVRDITRESFYYRTSTSDSLLTSGNSVIAFTVSTIPYGVGTLNDNQLEEFIIIPTQSFRFTSNNQGTISVDSGNTQVIGVGTDFTGDYRAGDYIVLGTQSPVRITGVSNNTLLTVANAAGSSLSSNAHYTAFPANVPINMIRDGRRIDIDTDKITVSMGAGINVGASFVMYHTLKEFEPGIRSKTLTNPVYIKLSTDSISSSTTGPWCLGIPDVLSVEGVYLSTGNNYSDTTTNYVNEFELETGQKDNYYGLAYLQKSPGSTLSISATNSILVKLKCFSHSAGKYISTESYPIDDSTVPLPSNKIRTQDIPVFTSKQTGRSFSLRDCIDCRPIVSNTAILSTTVLSASVDPSSTESFDSVEKFFPSPSNSMEGDVRSYLNRVDRVIIDESGNIRIIEGIPSNSPLTPAAEARTMDLGLVNVAPFPSLSSKEASNAKRPDLRNSIRLTQTVRYTMQDIKDIEERLQRLEYYSLLSTLEANVASLTIPSEANGSIEVFKNGFFVDSFDSYVISDLNDGEYKASVSTQTSRLTTQEEVTPVDLKYNTTLSSNVAVNGDLVSLSYDEEELIFQPVANRERTLVENFWSFNGNMLVVPRVDNYFDVDVTGTTSVEINIADPLQSLVDAQNEINKKLTQASTITNVADTRWNTTSVNGNVINQSRTITTDITDSFDFIRVPPVKTSTTNIRNLLTSVSVSPYIRAQRICLYISGLRPTAQHYIFFDGEDLTSLSRPAFLPSDATGSLSTSNFYDASPKTGSASLTANNTGELAVIIDLPGDRFTSGNKEFLVMDTDSLASEESATSKARGIFSSFGTEGTAVNLSIGTKTFDLGSGSNFSANTFSSTRTITEVLTRTFVQNNDPLAQSFIVQKIKGSEFIFLTSIDLYFRQKDNNNGVLVELREINDAGYPTSTVVPFSRVHKKPSEVNVSSTAATATRFTFASPVCVKTNTEYAIVISPDANSPEYRIWTSKTGIPDVATGLVSNESWGFGTMFYSTSNRAFTPVQDEDVKFRVNRAVFNKAAGTVVLNNGDYEYLTVNTVSGSFAGGEDIAQMSNSYINVSLTTNTSTRTVLTNTSLTSILSENDSVLLIYGFDPVSTSANVKVSSTTITNSENATGGTDFTTEYSVGDFIQIGSELRQVISISSDNSLTIDAPFSSTITESEHYSVTNAFDIARVIGANTTSITLNKIPSYSSNATLKVSLQKVVSGAVSSYNGDKNKLIIKDSTAANSTFLYRTANNSYLGYVIGDRSTAQAKIASIDNVSYASFVPLINVLQVPQSTVSMTASVLNTSNSFSTRSYSYVDRNDLNINSVGVIKSKTNEINGTTVVKSLTTTLDISTNYNDTSPVVDINPSSVIAIKYNISNTAASIVGENTRYGNAACKYISKRLVLADGLDAEDIKVYVRGYRPTSTDILVYAKILNSTDPDNFEDKDWTPLQLVTSSALFSSSMNINDLKQYEYTFRKTPLSTLLNGSIESSSNSTITGSGTNFESVLQAGDLVKIIRGSAETDYDILPVLSVDSDTQITLTGSTSFTAAGTIEKVTNKKEAFKYNRNDYVVRYHDEAGRAYDTYKYMSLKIVLTSSTGYLIPQIDDIRAIAVSV